jgi:glycosyltransferase involved in cell wall biosynthesis
VVLFVHNRYRTTGGEERAVEELAWVVRERLGEPVQLLARDSGELDRRAAAFALLRGGSDPDAVASAVRSSGARVVHAHNVLPTFGWRALAAARAAGARVVLHLHQYRLVCAIGVCYTRGAECTRCHGRDTSPGVRLNCRGNVAEAAAYGVSLALWQRQLVRQADAVIVPSVFARERLRALGAPLPWERVHVLSPPLGALDDDLPPRAALPSTAWGEGGYALVVSRLAPEKGVDVAIDACRGAGVPLVVAGDGPERARLEARAAATGGERSTIRFAGRVDEAELARLRAGAAIALVPSRAAETFGLAAAEAMAAGVPVAASRVGALPELVDERGLVPPGDAAALAEAIGRLAGNQDVALQGRERVAALCAPAVVAGALAKVYSG